METCEKYHFVSSIVITCMKDKSFELALDSKFLNQMPNIQELVDNVAAKSAEVSEGDVWFTKKNEKCLQLTYSRQFD